MVDTQSGWRCPWRPYPPIQEVCLSTLGHCLSKPQWPCCVRRGANTPPSPNQRATGWGQLVTWPGPCPARYVMKINIVRTASLCLLARGGGPFSLSSLLPTGGGGYGRVGGALGREVFSSCSNLGEIQEKAQGQGLNKESGLALFTRLEVPPPSSFKDPETR